MFSALLGDTHQMSIRQRRHIRFSLDIPATIITRHGEKQETVLQQISVGGCFTGWEENIYNGDEFRLEVDLPNGNRLPLRCKAVYRFENTGVGVKFLDITQFEQELISRIIANRMEIEGLPLPVSPFQQPSDFARDNSEPHLTDPRLQREEILESVMSGDEMR